MALIKCPECGREISDRALSCPGCGIAKDDIQKMFVEQNANDAKLHIDYDKLKKKEFNLLFPLQIKYFMLKTNGLTVKVHVE